MLGDLFVIRNSIFKIAYYNLRRWWNVEPAIC